MCSHCFPAVLSAHSSKTTVHHKDVSWVAAEHNTSQVLRAVLHITVVENMENQGYLYFLVLRQETCFVSMWACWEE